MENCTTQSTLAGAPQPRRQPDTATKGSGLLERRGFLLIYGWSGILMVQMFLLSGLWTLALAVIQLFPTEVANYLMGTADLDFGDFWILAKADDSISIPSAVLLTLFGIAYFGLVFQMSFTCRGRVEKDHARRRLYRVIDHPAASTRRLHARVVRAVIHATSNKKTAPRVLGMRQRTMRYIRQQMIPSLTHDDSPFLALPKLILQTTTLVRYLREGFPIPVISSYATLLFINWIITSFRSIQQRTDPRFVLNRVFYSFDLFFAVFAPLQALVSAYLNFSFNSNEFRTRTESFAAGNFERTARLFADPTEISLFRIAFESLQLTTPEGLAIKSALNIFTIRKWKGMIEKIRDAQEVPSAASSQPHHPPPRPSLALWLLRARTKFLSIVVFTVGAGIFVHSILAITTTERICRLHVECKVPSYKWNVGSAKCSCLVFINRFTRLKTNAEWLDPPETTESLRELASTGDLKIVQIVNRQLPTLPDELRGCKNLMQLVLLYTKITAIPAWTKEFTNMVYFHIQGDFTPKQITSLPNDLFSSMLRLRFLYLGALPKVLVVPDLSRLSRLKYLMLAVMHSMTKIPNLDGLVRLEQLTILDAIQVEALPSTKKPRKLKMFSLTNRDLVCCNGFIYGTCNLKHFACLDRTTSGEPPVRCTRERIDSKENKTLAALGGVFCDNNQTLDVKKTQPTALSIGACGGVIYKQCKLGNVTGMCFPARLMPIACQLAAGFPKMRRLQIARKVGDSCDPIVEGWLA